MQKSKIPDIFYGMMVAKANGTKLRPLAHTGVLQTKAFQFTTPNLRNFKGKHNISSSCFIEFACNTLGLHT